MKPFICTMPMRLDDGWNQIQFNLSDFTRRAYGTNYIETLRVQVSAAKTSLNEFIKNSASSMILLIVKLFNKILQCGKFPKIWNLSYVSSILKSGEPNDCQNYRGICVSSCFGKLFTSLLQTRLTVFLESKNLLSVNVGITPLSYAGFRAIFTAYAGLMQPSPGFNLLP